MTLSLLPNIADQLPLIIGIYNPYDFPLTKTKKNSIICKEVQKGKEEIYEKKNGQ